MYLKTTFDDEFYELVMYLKSKYPKKLFDLDGIGKQTDISEFSKEFFSNKTATADVSVDDNSNVSDKSVVAYTTELPKALFKFNSYFVLWKKLKQIYSLSVANDIIEKQIRGDIYINDLHGIGGGLPYCFNYSTLDIALKGLPMVSKIKSAPPKNILSFKSQLEQFITLASNASLGASGIADFLLTLSVFVDKMLKTNSDSNFKMASEDDIWIYVKENITSFIYTINQPMRGNQSPFTNISLYDKYFINEIIDSYKLLIDDVLYEATIDNVNRLQSIFLEIMNDEMRRTTITFPVVTACFSIDDEHNIKDYDFLNQISLANMKYAYINIYAGKTSTLSSCCRLRSDLETIGYQNSIGGSGTKIGSLGVCTVNLPRISFSVSDKTQFLTKLEELVYNAQAVNNAKRKIIQKRIDNNHAPLYKYGFMDINKQYSTVGVIGLNEALEILGYNILSQDGQDFAIEIMELISSINKKLDKKYDGTHNVEQIPGESTAVKLANKDKLLKYNDNRYDMYSNQFIPLISEANLLDRIILQGKFDAHFDGGSIAHLNIDEEITDVKDMSNLIITAIKHGVVYFAVNYVLNACENGHIVVGKDLTTCSICGGKITDKYTRVVGFLTNVKDWNETRREKDFVNRKFVKNINI